MSPWQRRPVGFIGGLVAAVLPCLFFCFSRHTESHLPASVPECTKDDKDEMNSFVTVTSWLPRNDTVAEIQRQRQKLLSEVCEKYYRRNAGDNATFEKLLRRMSAVGRQQAIYCPVSKAGITTLNRSLATALGVRGNIYSIALQRRYLPTLVQFERPQQERMLREYFSFMFVRHPFERLVSAWQNKLLKRRTRQYRQTAQVIMSRYPDRTNIIEKLEFKEFVQFLIDTRTKRPFDIHWRPFYEHCRPCQRRYDFIGHFETLEQDIEYVISRIGLPNVAVRHMNKSKSKSSTLVKEMMSTLSADEYESLINLYLMDFLLFGYSPENS